MNINKTKRKLIVPAMLAVAGIAFAGGMLVSYPFRIFVEIPKNEPHPGIIEIPSPGLIHSFTVSRELRDTDKGPQYYAMVDMVFTDGNTGVMQVDTQKLHFIAK